MKIREVLNSEYNTNLLSDNFICNYLNDREINKYYAKILLKLIDMKKPVGIYGFIKYIIEKDRPILVEYILKLIFANMAATILYFIVREFIYVPINIISIVTFEIIFVVYDYMYSRFIDYYNLKIKNIIKINK